MATQTYHVVLDKEEDGGYSVQCVEIPGAISQGNSREEAKNIKEAIELLLEHRASKVAGQRVEEVVVTT